MNRPISTFTDSHITNHQSLYTYQREHMRTRIKGWVFQGFQFITIRKFLSHKGNTISMDSPRAGDTQVLNILAMQPHHTFTAIILESTHFVNTFIGMGFQYRTCIKIQVYIRFQFYRTSKECLSTRQIHLSTSFCRTSIYGALNGYGIISNTVTLSTIIHYIIYGSLCEKAERGQ